MISFFLGRNSKRSLHSSFPQSEPRGRVSGHLDSVAEASCITLVVALALKSRETSAPNPTCAVYKSLLQGCVCSAIQTLAENSAVSISFFKTTPCTSLL